jgi:hypothetical protein
MFTTENLENGYRIFEETFGQLAFYMAKCRWEFCVTIVGVALVKKKRGSALLALPQP